MGFLYIPAVRQIFEGALNNLPDLFPVFRSRRLECMVEDPFPSQFTNERKGNFVGHKDDRKIPVACIS